MKSRQSRRASDARIHRQYTAMLESDRARDRAHADIVRAEFNAEIAERAEAEEAKRKEEEQVPAQSKEMEEAEKKVGHANPMGDDSAGGPANHDGDKALASRAADEL